MYAIVEDRGRQYKVREGEVVRVPKLKVEAGGAVVFDRVLLLGKDDGQVVVGSPVVDGVRVLGVKEGEFKDKKVISMRRIRTNSMTTRKGHRACLNAVRIQKIEA
jgi:large subunit ribosomal protein L21